MPDLTGRNILVIEDEASLAQLYSHHLGEKHDVEVETTGKQGIASVTPDTDLIFLDRKLGDITGDEVIEEVRRSETDCQIIMVTAVDPEFDIIEMDIEGYINKPVDKQDLLDAAKQAFLLEEYEELVEEFYKLRQKRATLSANFSSTTLQQADDERYTWLMDRLETVEKRISEIAEQFPNEDMSDAFMSVHKCEPVSSY